MGLSHEGKVINVNINGLTLKDFWGISNNISNGELKNCQKIALVFREFGWNIHPCY